MARTRSKAQRLQAKRKWEDEKRRRAQAGTQSRGAKVVMVVERGTAVYALAPVVRRLVRAGHTVKVLAVHEEVPQSEVWTMVPPEHKIDSEAVGWEPLAGDPSSLERQLEDEQADVLVVSPAFSELPELIRALAVARRRGVPTVGLPAAWDELGRSVVPSPPPDVVVAWNEPMAELARSAGLPRDRLVVTGAPHMDAYFRWTPDRHRESFCAEVGLDHRRPFIVYLAAGADEVDLATRLAAGLHEDPSTRHIQLLVRPQPWEGPGAEWEAPGATMWGLAPGMSHPRKMERELLTGVTHAAAAVGARAEALVVPAIANRPCTLLTGELTAGLHLDGLAQLGIRGSLPSADRLEQAVASIRAALADPQARLAEQRDFVGTFIRPGGSKRPVVAAVARLIESAGRGNRAGTGRSRSGRAGEPAPAPPLPASEPSAAEAELRQIARVRIANLVEIRQPLVLISQIQRSGGRLLNHLLDGHPQCHVHPHELHIGYPFEKESWPELDPDGDPEEWFEMLRQRPVEAHFFTDPASVSRRDGHPFLLVPSLQRELFRHCVATMPVASPRDILDCYMTSYFNAWLDNHNSSGEAKRWVVGFGSRLGLPAESRERFFRDYPDGRLISVVRKPESWFASARRFQPRYAEVERSMRLWSWSTRAMLEASESWGDRVLIVRFESLVQDTDATMRSLSEFLGIDCVATMLQPTFNGLPLRANSSFPVDQQGVLRDPVSRGEQLDPETLDYIESRTSDLYARVTALARP